MLTDDQLKKLPDEIVKLYQEIENSMLNKLGKFLDNNDEIGGSAKWYIKKLQEISNLNGDLIREVSKYINKSQKEVSKMFEEAMIANFVNGKNEGVTSGKLLENKYVKDQYNNFVTDMNRNLSKIRTDTINSTKEEYLRIVDKATIEVQSGVKSFSQSITDSLSDLGDRGITGQLYKRANGDIVRYNIEGLVRRDTLTGVFSIANQTFLETAKDNGIEYVYVSQHLGARTSDKSKIANHAGWQGKVYLLEGKDDEYNNFYEETGAGQVEGFGGPNCRHRVSAAYRGMRVPDKFDEAENVKVEEEFNKLRYLERGLRSWKRKEILFKASGNEDEYKKAKAKVSEWSKKIEEHTKATGIHRDYARERIAETNNIVKETKITNPKIVEYIKKNYANCKKDSVILLEKRSIHINKHLDAQKELLNNFDDIFNNPDIVIPDEKNKETIVFIKNIDNTDNCLNSYVRLIDENNAYKNSIITTMIKKQKRVKKAIDKLKSNGRDVYVKN